MLLLVFVIPQGDLIVSLFLQGFRKLPLLVDFCLSCIGLEFLHVVLVLPFLQLLLVLCEELGVALRLRKVLLLLDAGFVVLDTALQPGELGFERSQSGI